MQNNEKVLIPYLNTSARVWSDPHIKIPRLYLANASNGYYYIYKETGAKYDVYLDTLGNVEDFSLKKELAYSMIGKPVVGGGVVVEANWGDHYTIGVEQNPATADWMMMTHITTYRPSKLDATKYYRTAEECNIKMSDHIKRNTKCYQRHSSRQIGILEDYETYSNDYDIIPIVQSMYRKMINGSTSGGGIYGDDGFSDDFIQFVYEYRIAPLMKNEPNLYEVQLFDDQESKSIMIRCNTNVGDGIDIVDIESVVYVIPRIVVEEAFIVAQIPAARRTQAQDTILHVFSQPMTPIQMPTMIAVQ